MNKKELLGTLSIFETTVQKAGRLSLARYGQTTLDDIPDVKNLDLKDLKKAVKGKFGPVDREIEDMMLDFLYNFFPYFSVLTEEKSEIGQKFPSCANYRLVIDPIDGTFNYVLGNPEVKALIKEKYLEDQGRELGEISQVFSNCLALQETASGDFLLSAIHFPLLEKTYVAAKNCGSFLNNRPLKLRAKEYESDDLFCLSKSVSKELGPLLNSVESICASDSLVGVADGRFTGYISKLGKLWDVGPGLFIIQEAGGIVRTLDLKPPGFKTLDGQLNYTVIAGPSENYIRQVNENIVLNHF